MLLPDGRFTSLAPAVDGAPDHRLRIADHEQHARRRPPTDSGLRLAGAALTPSASQNDASPI